jgi:hypothetical protein
MGSKKQRKDENRSDLFRVVVMGREVRVEKVVKGDHDYEVARQKATDRLVEAMKIMRDQESDLSRLDSVNYFLTLGAAKDFARMAFKDLSETLSLTWDAVEAYDGTLPSSAMLRPNALRRPPPPGRAPDLKDQPVPDLDAD